MGLYDNLDKETQARATAIQQAYNNKGITLDDAAMIIAASPRINEGELVDQIVANRQAAHKSGMLEAGRPQVAAQKAALQKEIDDLQARYDKARDNGQTQSLISIKNSINSRVNQIKALG